MAVAAPVFPAQDKRTPTQKGRQEDMPWLGSVAETNLPDFSRSGCPHRVGDRHRLVAAGRLLIHESSRDGSWAVRAALSDPYRRAACLSSKESRATAAKCLL